MNRNAEGMPYWGTLTEITMLRAQIAARMPAITSAAMDAMTYAQLSELHTTLILRESGAAR